MKRNDDASVNADIGGWRQPARGCQSARACLVIVFSALLPGALLPGALWPGTAMFPAWAGSSCRSCRRQSTQHSARHTRQQPTKLQVRPVITRITPAAFEFEIPHPAQGRYPAQVELTVTGTGFGKGAVVLFNRKAVKTTFVSSKHLAAQVPFSWVSAVATDSRAAGPDGFRGTAGITVRNPGKRGVTSSSRAFPIVATPID
jgi:hypothetical protein